MSKLSSFCSLAREQKCLAECSFTAQLERSEIFKPWAVRNIWLGLNPKAELIQIVEADLAVAHALDQMVSYGLRQPRPALELRHYSPKTKRPNSSPSCLASAASCDERKRCASSKKAFSFSFWASMPSSMSSTRTRLSLSLRRRAMLATFRAVGSGRVKLRRTCFVVFTAPFYTSLVQRGLSRGGSCNS
jgi:hypothetical protein